MEVVVAPDKFRGTLSAAEAAKAMASGARELGWMARESPLADGGEGTLEVLGGPNRTSTVTGPLGAAVVAGWRLEGDLAVIEMATASGALPRRPSGGQRPGRCDDVWNGRAHRRGDPVRCAADHRRRRRLGYDRRWLGAIDALGHRRFTQDGVAVEVACDVESRFSKRHRCSRRRRVPMIRRWRR